MLDAHVNIGGDVPLILFNNLCMDRRFTIPDGVLWEKLDDQVVLMDLETETYHSVDPVGTRIWGLACDGQSESQIVRYLLEEYDVSEDIAREDVSDLLTALSNLGLLLQN